MEDSDKWTLLKLMARYRNELHSDLFRLVGDEYFECQARIEHFDKAIDALKEDLRIP